MNRDDNIIAYDFQGWPYHKMNLKEILLALGGKIDGDSISFDLHHPLLDVYPMVYTDDGMGYYVDESFIVWAEASEDNTKITLQRERPEKSKKQEEYEVIESGPRPSFTEHQLTQQLQLLLAKACIEFIAEHKLDNIEEINFSISDLVSSMKKQIAPEKRDSCIQFIGLRKEVRKMGDGDIDNVEIECELDSNYLPKY